MKTTISPGEAFMHMVDMTDKELIEIASLPGNGYEVIARDILRGRMTSTWKGPK